MCISLFLISSRSFTEDNCYFNLKISKYLPTGLSHYKIICLTLIKADYHYSYPLENFGISKIISGFSVNNGLVSASTV